MLIGYARGSTQDQTLDLQTDALRKAGCEKLFQDITSGVKSERPGLQEAMDHLRTGDTLVVWRLDRTQLLADTRVALPMEPGKTQREDYEYKRQGVCNVFLACEPLMGKCYTMVVAQRTKQEWAQFMRQVADSDYPDAGKIVLVMDNLKSHTLASLYEVFPVAEARRHSPRFEVHYTRHPCELARVLAEIEQIARWIGNACRNAYPPLRKESKLVLFSQTDSLPLEWTPVGKTIHVFSPVFSPDAYLPISFFRDKNVMKETERT